jgi:hypothetical protein
MAVNIRNRHHGTPVRRRLGTLDQPVGPKVGPELVLTNANASRFRARHAQDQRAIRPVTRVALSLAVLCPAPLTDEIWQ